MSGLDAWFEEYGLSGRIAARRAQLELARVDERVFSLENDLGSPDVPFATMFPDRYLQVGIAEANLLGVAAGLAERGCLPFVNTFAVFAAMRACEQIRIDVAYHQANVKIMGYYAGVSGGWAGPSHQCIEDLAVVQAIPGITVLSPADAYEAYKATIAARDHDGPVYIRIGRAESPRVYDESFDYRIGPLRPLITGGSDVTILATGELVVPIAMQAAALLRARGVDCAVSNVHTIKPLDEAGVVQAARTSALLVTAEDHSVVNGLGSAVARVVAREHPVPLLRFGIQQRYCAGDDHARILAGQGLSAPAIADRVLGWAA